MVVVVSKEGTPFLQNPKRGKMSIKFQYFLLDRKSVLGSRS
jgi:hypothetical protein